jgi:hypothetical protein
MILLSLASYSTAALLVGFIFMRNQWRRIDSCAAETEVVAVLAVPVQRSSDSELKVVSRTEAEQELFDGTFNAVQMSILQKWQGKFSEMRAA